MANTLKPLSKKDSEQTLRNSYNDVNASLTVDGFLTGKVGRRVELEVDTTNVTDDTEIYTFLENSNVLYELTIIYTDGTRALMLSAERTA